jgi:DNA mismatch endonuclease (patch repair protein)
MADRLTAQARSRNMARVRDRNTGPELTVRRLLHRMGYRFRLHRKDLPGRPDIVLPRYRSVIFVHGCFWHGHSGCRAAARPTSNAEFWNRKLDSNIQRDQAVRQELTGQKWNVLVVWECELREIQALEERLRAFLQPDNDNCKGEAASGDQ